MKKYRRANIKRKTTETNIKIGINLDGSGKAKIKSPIGFLNHMLNLFAKHGVFDLELDAKGDTEIDIHHTNEDIAITLGMCLKEALGKKFSIRRFGFASVPMDDSLVEVSLDLCGRPYFKLTNPLKHTSKESGYGLNYLKQFLYAFVNNAGITLHVEIISGEDLHHIIEATFKALARALKEAVSVDSKLKTIPSTKGIL